MRLLLMSVLLIGMVFLVHPAVSYADDGDDGDDFSSSDSDDSFTPAPTLSSSSGIPDVTDTMPSSLPTVSSSSSNSSSNLLSSIGLSSFGLTASSNGNIGVNLGFTSLNTSSIGGSSLSSSNGLSTLGSSIPSSSVASSTGSYSGTTIADLLCQVASWFMGSIGQGIATLAVIVLGIGALMGKVSHGMVLTTLVGIAVIFGAPDIVQDLTGQAACYSS